MAEAVLEASEVDASALVRQTTVRALLEVAIRFEWNAHHFYSGLIERVRPALAPLVAELANEEREHHRHLLGLLELLELLEREDYVELLRDQIEVPHTAARFERLSDHPGLPAEPTDDDVLALALAREETAAAHYARLAEDAEQHPALRDAFAYLRDEERSHAAQAVGYAERASRAAPSLPAIADTLGAAQLAAGQAEAAVVTLRGAHEAMPTNADVTLNYARALAATGAREEARRLLLPIAEQPYAGAEAVQELLESLQ
jgi:rubrerythrin